MKKISNLRSALPYVAAAIFLTSCTADPEWSSNSGIDGAGSMATFRVDVPASSQIATRALSYAQEYAVETVDLLVFENGAFSYSVTGVITSAPTGSDGSDATMTFKTPLVASTTPADFMIVANARDLTADIAEGNTPADVAQALQLDMPETGWVSDPAAAGYMMPMWGYLTNQTVDDAYFEQAHAVKLTRMLAKVDVGLDTDITPDKFTLEAVSAYNYATQGTLVPDLTLGWDTEDFELDDYTAPSPMPWAEIMSDGENEHIDRTVSDGKSLTGEIYLFEAEKGVAPTLGSDAFVANPCLVIGGNFEGGETTYYRIDFAIKDIADADTDGDTDEMVYLPLLRNNSYTITINDVSGPGYKTPEEAYRSVPTNINATIVNWNGNDILLGITDGVHTLGITSDSYELIPEAHIVAGDDNRLTIATNFPEGWTAAVFEDEACETPMAPIENGGWLALSETSGPENYPDGKQTYFVTSELPDEVVERPAWVKVTAGTMTYIIKVVQMQIEINIIATDAAGNPLGAEGEEIETLSFASTNSMLASGGIPLAQVTRSPTFPEGVAPAPKYFKVEWHPASMPLRIIKFPSAGVESILTWQDASNDLDYLSELTSPDGEQIFKVDPKPFKAETIAEYPFYKEGTSMAFQIEGTSVTKTITIDMTHYNFLVSGINSRVGVVTGTTETAFIRCNVPWQMTLTDVDNILDLAQAVEDNFPDPYLGEANIYGSNHVYRFNGNIGSATFKFDPQPGNPEGHAFDPITMTISSQNITSRFAKSNIVMVKNSAGEKMLTFAETEEDWGDNGSGGKDLTEFLGRKEVIPADAAGLFFLWGGLVGMSPDGQRNASGSRVGPVDMSMDPETGEVVFWPELYGNVPPAGEKWDITYSVNEEPSPYEIPYVKIDEKPAWTTNEDLSLQAFDDLYGGTGYDEVAGKGDICRYISAKGWVDGNWRIPTARELHDLFDETSSDSQGGIGVSVGYNPEDVTSTIPKQGPELYGFTSIPTGRFVGASATGLDNTQNPIGHATLYFPASGDIHRIGVDYEPDYREWRSTGYYISATPTKYTNADESGVVNLNGFFFVSYITIAELPRGTTTSGSSYYNDATPIRCIRED